jgi:hypothetical protein
MEQATVMVTCAAEGNIKIAVRSTAILPDVFHGFPYFAT